MEELHLGLHDMVSPRMKSARNVRISAVRANDPDHPLERPGFKFYKRCGFRDTATFFQRMEYMER
eukprot:7390613-Heterocapsa_arctica.AAC.1